MYRLSVLLLLCVVTAPSVRGDELPLVDNPAREDFHAMMAHLAPGGPLLSYTRFDDGFARILDRAERITVRYQDLLETEPEERRRLFRVLRRTLRDSGAFGMMDIGRSGQKLEGGALQVQTLFRLRSEAEAQGLWRLFGTAAHALEVIRYLPEDTVLTFAGDLDLAYAWERLTAALQAELPAAQWDGFNARLAQMKQMGTDVPGLLQSLEGSLAGALVLGEPITFQVRGTELAMPRPDLLFAVKVGDATLREQVAFRARQVGLPFQPVQGKEKHWQQVTPIPIPIPLGWCFAMAEHEDYLLLASRMPVLEAALAARAAEEAPLLRRLRAELPGFETPAKLNGMTLLDRRFREALATVQGQVAAGLQMDPMAVMQPSTEVFYWQRVEPGLRTVGYTDAGVEGMSAATMLQATAGVAIGAGMALPVLSKARERARRASAAGDIKQIGLGLMMYTGDHDGWFPKPDGAAGLREAWEKDYFGDDLELFMDPSQDRKPQKLVDEQIGYLYIGAGWRDSVERPHELPIIVNRPGIRAEFVNVGFADGHVEGFSGSFPTVQRIIQHLHERFRYDEERLKTLMDKARAMDKKLGLTR